MNRPLMRAGLLVACGLAPAALAQTASAPKPVTTLKGTLTLQVPAGAKTLVIARSGSETKLVAVLIGATRIVVGLNLRPKLYQDSYSVRGTKGKGSSEGAYISDGTYTVSPFKAATLSPPLNVWTTLWQGTQGSSTTFSFSLGDKNMSGAAQPDAFRVQVLFSKEAAAALRTNLRPPKLP